MGINRIEIKRASKFVIEKLKMQQGVGEMSRGKSKRRARIPGKEAGEVKGRRGRGRRRRAQ